MPVVPSRALPQAWRDEVIDISDDMEMEQYEIQEEKDKEQEMEVACTRAPKTNRVTISMSIIKDLLGESVKIPMKVKVDVPGEGERQLMWLRKNSLDYGVLYFAQPLFSKIKSCQPCFRKWSLSESGGSDGIPCLTLELGRAEMLPDVETAAPKRRTKVGASVTPLRGISAMGSKWFAQISFKGKNHYLGTYSTAEEAARAYDSAAYYLKGPKAVLNFPNDLQPISNDLKARICAHSPAGGDQEPSQSQERVEEEVEEEEEEEDEEEEEEDKEEVEEREIEVVSSKPRNLITVNMSLVRGLLGESVKLPIKVKVDVSGEDARQLVWLRKNSEIRGAFYFDEPVLSKIKSCSFQQRKWSRSESGGSDGMPCLSLELGANHTPAAGEGLTTRFRGVYFFGRRWKALVSAQGRNWHLGSHATAEEAARVYDSAAYYFKGAQARLNFPDEQPRPLSDELKNKLDAAAQGNLMGSEVNEEQKDVEAEEEEEGDQEGIVNGDDDKMTKKRRRRKTWRGVMSGDEGDGNDDVMDVEEEDARAPFSHRNRVGIALSTVMMLLGESVKLPIKVMVDVPGAGERQLLWLKQKNSTQASLYFTDPLLSKIKSCNFQQRKWSLVESGGLDGIPCLSLELGNNDTAAAGVGLTTRFRGVSALGSRWSAHIWANSKAWYLGSHSTAEEAARVYDSAAYYFKGAQARLNFPDEQPQPLSDELKNKLGAAAQGYLVGRRIKVEPDVEDEEVVEGGDLDESNEDEDEGLDKSGEEEGAFSPSIHQKNRIGIAITTARRLLGVSFHLPMKVMVDVPSERTSQLVWMKKHSSTQASLYFTNPLLSKMKSCNFHQRQWSLSESGGSDGVPCLSLELGVKDKSSNLRRIIDFDDEVEEEEEGRWGGRVSSEVTPTQAQSPRGAPRIILPPPAATDPRPLAPFLPPPLAMPSLPLHLERKMTPIELVSRVTAMELARRLLDAEERLSSSEMREMEMGKRLVQMSDEMTRLKRQRENS